MGDEVSTCSGILSKYHRSKGRMSEWAWIRTVKTSTKVVITTFSLWFETMPFAAFGASVSWAWKLDMSVMRRGLSALTANEELSCKYGVYATWHTSQWVSLGQKIFSNVMVSVPDASWFLTEFLHLQAAPEGGRMAQCLRNKGMYGYGGTRRSGLELWYPAPHRAY